MAKNITKNMTTFNKDILSLIGSTILLSVNITPLIPLTLISLSAGNLLYNLSNNEFNKAFKNNNICNSSGEYPKLLHKFKSSNDNIITETKYIFKMPDKLTPYDLINAQPLLESSIHKPMRITATKNFYAEITVFEEDTLNYIWYNIFRKCNIKNKYNEYPKLIKTENTKIGLKYIFKLPIGLCLEMIENILPLLESAMNKPLKLDLTKDNLLIIQEYQLHYSRYYLPRIMSNIPNKVPKDIHYITLPVYKNKLIFPIGITLTTEGEKIVTIDLTDEPHILVAGTNGSGKTSFIKCLLTLSILRNIEIKIIDLKFGGDYNIFKYYKNLTAFTKDVQSSREEIFKIKEIMEKRYDKLDKHNCKNYISYNNKFNNTMKPIIVIIEEYYMLNTKKNKITDELNQILAKSRACNIKFIISLQRPCKDNLSPILKANLNHTVGFRTVSIPNSEVVLGERDKRLYTELHDKGEAIIHDIYQDIQFKSFFLEDDKESSSNIKFDLTIDKIIEPYNDYNKYEENEENIRENKLITLPKSLPKKVNLFAK